jgi:hypothetical protein
MVPFMGLDEWSLVGVNAAAALLLNSGMTKAVWPDPLWRALSEMIPAFRADNAPTLLRGLAAVEVVTGRHCSSPP